MSIFLPSVLRCDYKRPVLASSTQSSMLLYNNFCPMDGSCGNCGFPPGLIPGVDADFGGGGFQGYLSEMERPRTEGLNMLALSIHIQSSCTYLNGGAVGGGTVAGGVDFGGNVFIEGY